MSRFKRLIVETHQRSLWQALTVYVGAAFGVIGVVDIFIEYFGLPRWLIWVAFALLVTGLPVVIVISLAKEEVYGEEVPAEHAEEAAEEDRRLRLLTWRTAGFAFVGVLAVWGLVAAGWVVAGGSGFLLTRAEAADLVDPEDCVVVAQFANETEDEALGLAVRTLVVTDIGQTSYVNVLGDERLRGTLELMRLPDTTGVDQHLALEIANRERCPAVVAGTVAPLGTGYVLNARILEAATGEEVVPVSEMAVDDPAVQRAAQRLTRRVRRHLGESLASIRRSEPLERVTTSSLEALKLYSRAAVGPFRVGDWPGAIALLEQAVQLDTVFAEAYRKLSAAYANGGQLGEGYQNIELAHRLIERLPQRERLQTLAVYHWYRGRPDSAAHYELLGFGLFPNPDVWRNNLATEYYEMGQFEEALEVYLELMENPHEWYGVPKEAARTARTLNRHALAESALAIMREKVSPQHPEVFEAAAWNAYYAGDLLLADSLAREMATDSRWYLANHGRLLLAGSASMHGRMKEALALADSAARVALERIGRPNRSALQLTEYASLAASTPEGALPYLENARSQLTLGDFAPREHRLLGHIACGYALAGDVRSARQFLALMDSLIEDNGSHPTGISEQVLAVLALQEGRAEEAVEHLRRTRAAEFGLHRWEVRWLLAEAHAALGNLDEAVAQYDTLTRTYRLHHEDLYVSYPLRPLAHERLGSLYLQVGDTVAAARHLAEFIELWKDADPELQPRVEAARRRLAGLVVEGTR